jgi:ribosomal small subunit protein bTHX
MGKGDKRSKKGKINIASYGVTRPRPAVALKKKVDAAKAEPKVKKVKAVKAVKEAKPATAKKTVKKKTE